MNRELPNFLNVNRSPRCESASLPAVGVGLPPDAGAGGEERFVPDAIGPRRSQAGRLRNAEGPFGARERAAGPPWLDSPARREPVRMSSSLIVRVAESRCNTWVGSTPYYAPSAGRTAFNPRAIPSTPDDPSSP
jgi:hypothetical protein